MEVGLALAGGGTKAAAHVGVLQALEENKIKIKYISGTSSGSIAATLYAIGYSPKEILNLLKDYSKKIKYVDFFSILKLIIDLIFKNKIIISGLNNGKKLEKIIKKYCEEKNIKNINEIKMPLIIPTVNLENGELIIFSSNKKAEKREIISDKIVYEYDGEISKIVTASCAYPGVFCPVKNKNKLLIDGGVRENIPWKELKKLGAEKIIVSCFEEKINKKCSSNFIDVIGKGLKYSNHELAQYELEGVEYLIKTKLNNVSLLDYSHLDEMYVRGYEEANRKIKEFIKNS